MLKNGYVFETRKIPYWRYLKFIAGITLSLLFFYLLVCLGIVFFAQNQNKLADIAFYNKSPDLIVVFTGDAGRIPFALKKAKEFKQSNIFITGVYYSSSVKSILTPLQISSDIDPRLFEIDHIAQNTVENAISTLRYLRDSPGMNSVLVISHDYHMLRIKMVIEKLQSPEDHYNFFYIGIPSDYGRWRYVRILLIEVWKLARTLFFLALWGSY
ncbi:MAG: YdcF family protein [Pseudomonadota bacterium]